MKTKGPGGIVGRQPVVARSYWISELRCAGRGPARAGKEEEEGFGQ